MSNWLEKFIKKTALKKEAIDKLPEAELNGDFGSLGPSSAGAQPPSDPNAPPDPNTPPDPNAGMPPIDPSMMMPPEESPLVWNNQYLVKTDSTEFIVKLTPSIVNAPPPMPSAAPEMPPGAPPQDPMADKTLNPNADPQAMQDWINSQSENLGKSKPFSSDEKAPADPLTAEEEGLPIEDTGDEKSLNPKVKVHQKKTAAEIIPGIDRSNAYAPCSFCSNYIAADNDCAQGLDVEKVQAAKSCSWINSTMKPFKAPSDPMANGEKNKETTITDVSDIGGGGGESASGPNKFASLRERLDKFI